MRERTQNMAGDMRQSARHAGIQPLALEERELLSRGYALFEHFREGLMEEHEEMRDARRLRQLRSRERSGTSPAFSTLNSCIDNVVADQSDNMPMAVMIPEREETIASAEEMSDVIGYVLYHAGWPGKYQRIIEDAVVTGTGVAQVFWDDELEDGEGMVGVLSWHPEDFYPDPLYEDIQDGRACFKATHTTIAWIEEHFPHARGYVTADENAQQDGGTAEGFHPEAPEGDGRTTLLEFWYKRYDSETRKTRVHMAQMAGGALLLSTQTGYGLEGGEAMEQGVYAHGQYPFTMYRYRDVWRRPFGSGLAHDYRATQEAIDRYAKYIDDNARESSVQRHFIRRGSGVNAEDVADMRKSVIEWDGNDIREVLQTIQTQPLNAQVYQMMQYMADMMKQDCGQNQFARGEGGLNVTAGTAINALQEAGSKIARWHTERFKDAFRGMVTQMIWVLSEYLEPGRKLRIVGGWENGDELKERIIELAAPQAEGDELLRPAYSVRVQVQKNRPDQIAAENEFLLQAASICAQAGTPLPAEKVIAMMQGQTGKSRVLRALSDCYPSG